MHYFTYLMQHNDKKTSLVDCNIISLKIKKTCRRLYHCDRIFNSFKAI